MRAMDCDGHPGRRPFPAVSADASGGQPLPGYKTWPQSSRCLLLFRSWPHPLVWLLTLPSEVLLLTGAPWDPLPNKGLGLKFSSPIHLSRLARP